MKQIKFLAMIFMVTTMIFSFLVCSSCSNSKEYDPTPTNPIVEELQKYKWYLQGYGTLNIYDEWIDFSEGFVAYYFTSDTDGVLREYIKTYDSDDGISTSTKAYIFTYSVSGETIYFDYSNGYSISKRMTYSKDGLTDEYGNYFERQNLTSDDRNWISKNGIQSGSCGSKATWKFDPSDNWLTISGTGEMNDYTKGKQPWADLYVEGVEFEDGITYVGKNAFNGIYPMLYIDMNSTITSIGDYAFANTLVEEFYGENELQHIGNGAFEGCTKLKKLDFDLHSELKTIGDDAFFDCALNFSTFTLPDELISIGDRAFGSGCKFSKVTFNDKLQSIGSGAFGSIGGTITLPNSLTTLGGTAFCGSFTKVTIGAGLTDLGNNAFCPTGSGSMYVNLGVPPTVSGVLNDYESKWSLYVPKGSKSAYQSKSPWSKFKSINEDSSLVSGNGTPENNPNDDPSSPEVPTTATNAQEQDLIDAADSNRGSVSSSLKGSGTQSDPYQVSSAADLRFVSDECRRGRTFNEEYLKQTKDIVINQNVIDSNGELNYSSSYEPWIPIGRDYDECYFKGTYNGNGHSISGIYINREVRDNIGLFGEIFNATIKNLVLKDSYFCGISFSGGIVGEASYGQLENCINYATVEGYNAGGIGGNLVNSTVTKCGNNGLVKGAYAQGISNKVGGLGTNQSSTKGYLINSYNKGRIEGTQYAGGMEYEVNGNPIINCVNYGEVVSKGSSGCGIIYKISNDFYPYNKCMLTNCVNIGNVYKNDSSKGNAIYEVKGTTNVENNYYLETSGTSPGTSKTENQMKSQSFLDELNKNAAAITEAECCGWKFGSEGYPILDWMEE
ncbi:MAG: leucine-rich repeat domain-containing protein [Bacteroidales bacterium]|nr:leucine-rich repeat domain-containing protein [Bacteroidales bacterium]